MFVGGMGAMDEVAMDSDDLEVSSSVSKPGQGPPPPLGPSGIGGAKEGLLIE